MKKSGIEKPSAFGIELDREKDGRWIAEISKVPGAMAYGATKQEATRKAFAIALRTLADGIEQGLGYGDVRTLLNSGNVVFTVRAGSSGDAATRIEKAIATRLCIETRVTVLKGKDVVAAVRDNPFASIADDPSRLLLMTSPDPKTLAQLKPLLKERWTPEALALGARVAYLWCAGGVVDSRLWAAANRQLADTGTARNLSTMTKLVALLEGA